MKKTKNKKEMLKVYRGFERIEFEEAIQRIKENCEQTFVRFPGSIDVHFITYTKEKVNSNFCLLRRIFKDDGTQAFEKEGSVINIFEMLEYKFYKSIEKGNIK